MPLPHEFIGGAANSTKGIASMVGAAGLLAATGFRITRHVPTEHMGVFTFCQQALYTKAVTEVRIGDKVVRQAREEGEVRRIVPAGRYKVFPFLQNLKMVSIADNNDGLGNMEFDNPEGDQYKTEAWMTWHVLGSDDNPYRALYRPAKPTELGQRVRSICITGLSQTLSTMNRTEFRDIGNVNDAMQEACSDKLLYYGVALKEIDMQVPALIPAEKYRQGIREGLGDALGSILRSQLPSQNLGESGLHSA